MNEIDTSVAIAKLNDKARRSMQGCVVSRGVSEMYMQMNEIFIAVRDYTEFNEDDDPYREHDFGSFELSGIKFFWKIDYYQADNDTWCDPLDEACRRTLTIMLADEY